MDPVPIAFEHLPALARLDGFLRELASGCPILDPTTIDDVAAPELLARMPADQFVQTARAVSSRLGRFEVERFHATRLHAAAEIRAESGEGYRVAASVEHEAPHRFVRLAFEPMPHPARNPNLPASFDDYPIGDGSGAGCFVLAFTGVPGTGKSRLADEVGRRLGVPVLAIDWLLGALTPYRVLTPEPAWQWELGFEQVTHMLLRQLMLGQSAILDTPAEDPAVRTRWEGLAARFGARLLVVECVCTDSEVHRGRLEGRARGIPGWHEGGNWNVVEERLTNYVSWDVHRLVVDAVNPAEENVAAILEYVNGRTPDT